MSSGYKRYAVMVLLVLCKLILWTLLGMGFIWAVIYGFITLLMILPYHALTNVMLAAGFIFILWLVFIVAWTSIDKILHPKRFIPLR